MKEYLTSKEEDEIIDSIEEHSTLIYTIMKFSNIFYSDNVQRACVLMNQDGTFNMLINKKFWKTLNFYEKKFLICHELLHILYNHLHRMKNMANKDNANIAADIVVNESLVKHFDFDRKYIRFENLLCWIDTVFNKKDQKDEDKIKSFEYYYVKINSVEINDKKILDNHDLNENKLSKNDSESKLIENNEIDLNKNNVDIVEDFYKSLLDKVDSEIKNLDKNELEKIKKETKDILNDEMIKDNNIESNDFGWSNGLSNKVLSYKYRVNLYPFFKRIITNWYQSFDKEKEEDQFIFTEPLLELVSEKLKMPSEYEVEDKDNNKNNLWVFMDVSGSCKEYIEDYVRVCMGIPKENFNIKYFSFTTEIQELKVKNKKINLKNVWGGTNFNCIDDYILKCKKENEKNIPDNVFVMTDGFAPKLKIKSISSKKWYFFITPCDNNLFSINIPDGVNIFNFNDIT